MTASEAIEVSPETFRVSTYPAETHVETISLTNNSTAAIHVGLFVTKSGPSADKLEVTHPDTVTVPGETTETTDITLVAEQDIIPGSYEVEVAVTR